MTAEFPVIETAPNCINSWSEGSIELLFELSFDVSLTIYSTTSPSNNFMLSADSDLHRKVFRNGVFIRKLPMHMTLANMK